MKLFAPRTAARSRRRFWTTVAAVLVAVGLAGGRPTAQPTHMPVDQVRPGMIGEGFTVFSGTERTPFRAHILGVLQNVLGPRRSLILARLEGGPLAQTGVIAGMSGSPVFVDGRLLGAVSYSLGSFSKEPIAGITPIGEMTELAAPQAPRRAAAPVAFAWPLSHESMAQVLRRAFQDSAFALRPDDVRETAGTGLAGWSVGLRPIATPLAVSGLDSAAFGTLAAFFRDTGFLPAATAAAGTLSAADAGPLQAGDAIGVSLVSGDFALGATGTVTLVDGKSVYAFGHPFYNLGPTSFPMTRAWVHTVLPSMQSSMKLASLGEVIGTIQQDRATAIAGTLGPGPAMIPMHIVLDGARGQRRSFNLRIVDDQLFTPLLTYVSILSVLQSYEREAGAATFQIKGEARVKGHGAVALEDIFAGDQPSIPAAAYVVTPIMALLRNDRTPVEIEGVDLTISAMEQPRTATLERVWIDEARVRPGENVTLRMLLRSWRGEDQLRTLPLAVPANASGSLTLLVADGARLAQWEQREWKRVFEGQSIPQLIRVLNTTRRHNRLYVRLIDDAPGAVVDGEPMPALPPSVLAVLGSDREGGRMSPLRQSVVGAWDVAADGAVVGARTLTLTVEPR